MISKTVHRDLQRLNTLLHDGSVGAGDGPGFTKLVNSLKDKNFPRVWWENLETEEKTANVSKADEWIAFGAQVRRHSVFHEFPALAGLI